MGQGKISLWGALMLKIQCENNKFILAMRNVVEADMIKNFLRYIF